MLAGILAGLAIAARPSTAVPIAVLVLALMASARPASWRFVAGALLALLPIGALNLHVYGSALGEYGRFGRSLGSINPLVLATLLFSPSRGLFVWSPYLLVPVGLVVVAVARRRIGPPTVLLAAAASLVLLVASYDVWSGGFCLGPRLLCEAALMLTLALPYCAEEIERFNTVRLLMILGVLISAHIHTIAAIRNDGGWSEIVFQGVQEPSRFWSIRDSQLAWILR